MRKLTILLLLMALLPISTTNADQAFVGALRFDDAALYGSFGIASGLGSGIYLLNYADIGENGKLNSEVFKLFSLAKFSKALARFNVGPVAGPNIDWQKPSADSEIDPIAYVVGASGIAMTYTFHSDFSLFGMYKRRWAVEGGTMYENGWYAGAGFWLKL